jgi:hypothetical protein
MSLAMTSVVTPTSGNPPLAIPITFSGSIRLDNAINVAGPALAPQTVDHDFDNAYMQSWNLNVQHQFTPFVLMVGYVGSKGTQLITRRNINQPVNGVRPYPLLSNSSPILPGSALGNITQAESSGNSSYNAIWVTARRRLTRNLQFDASYTWSKSLDYNSFSTQGVVAQNSYDLVGSRGLSDFDARHRFVVSALYELPFHKNQWVDGWQLSAIVQFQSGNPLNVITTNSTVMAWRVPSDLTSLAQSISLAKLMPGSTPQSLLRSRALAIWAETWLSVHLSVTPTLRSPKPRALAREFGWNCALKSSTFLITRTLDSPAM